MDLNKKAIAKDKILKAAAEVFAKYGFEKTTLEDVGNSVGLNKSSLYHYYKNKLDIFYDVVLAEAEVFISELQQKQVKKKDKTKQIISYLKQRIDYYKKVLYVNKVSVDLLKSHEAQFRKLYEKIMATEVDFVTTIIEEGIKEGEYKKVPAKKLARIIINVCDAFKQKHVQQSTKNLAYQANYDQLITEVEEVVEFLLKSITK